MARFFIDRPVFAWVLALVVMLAGALSIANLPIAQYPAIAPPTVSIAAQYPGASARTLEDTVTQVIEQKMKGLDRLSYMASTSDSNGGVTITLTFENGTNPDTAQVQVQNKLALATPLLPQEVQQQGVTVSKASNSFLVVLAFTSKDGRLDNQDLADFVAAQVQEPLSRVEGVGDTQLFGGQYAMRVWLDPAKLNGLKLTAAEVAAAIQSKNVQVAAGQLGGLPAVSGQAMSATITAQSKLKTREEFEQIVLRKDSAGGEVLLRDVARIELGSETYATGARWNGQPAAGLAVKLATGANALDTVKRLDTALQSLQSFFPAGVEVHMPYDTTPFVRIAIFEVLKTLAEAVALVFLVMYLFLQNWRATLIPTIAVPVVLLGTFGVLFALGFTINTLTMFAVVLAIGLLVDDAIVVVENVERVMTEEGLSPREATRKSMGQITGALVGVALVLSAVFVPMAFFGGSTGVIYRQFAVTIVTAMVLSVLVAMVLTPALTATLLKPVAKGHALATTGFFGAFNRGFDAFVTRYTGGVSRIVKRGGRWLVLYAVLVAAMLWAFGKVPTGFLPEEDQGVMFVSIQLPPGASAERTRKVIAQVEQHFLVEEKDAVDSLISVSGFSFAGSGQNMGIAFVKLKPWDERKAAALKVSAVQGRAFAALGRIREATIFPFAPPAVSELGNAAGFDLQLQDRANLGHEALTAARNQLLAAASQDKRLVGVRANGQEDAAQWELAIDERKAGALGVALSDINSNLSIAWGGRYVNDFIDRGRVKKVFVQADAPYRMSPADLERWHVKNARGDMVPFSAFATAGWTSGPPRLERFNGQPSANILGMAMPGQASSGEAMQIMEELVAKLPPGIGHEWSGISRQERESGSQTLLLYGISIAFVFLCLAALYESWSIPVAVLLVVPLGLLGALVGALVSFKMNDVYFQVGLLTTIGLASKNAILIVEFAKSLVAQGRTAVEAAVEAARLRLRPILMTSLAFVLGVMPLVVSSGAGSGAQNALGTAVVGGMLSGTVLAIFFVPLFFVVVQRLSRRRPAGNGGVQPTPVEA